MLIPLLLFAGLTILTPEPGELAKPYGPWFLVHTIPFEDTQLRTWEGPYNAYAECDAARKKQVRETPGEDLECTDGSDLDL